MIEGLRRNDVEVIECQVPLWRGIEDRVRAASGKWLRAAFISRLVRTYWNLLRAYRKVGSYDVMVLGYPGQLDVLLARLLTWLRRKPLVLDVFMSIYLIAAERSLIDRHPITARLIHWLEKLACLLPDRLIIDTQGYVTWFEETYGTNSDRFRLVPTGADERIFQPREGKRNQDNDLFKVLYYGTFIPNHGVKYIIEAANILKNDCDIRFELVGTGPTRAQAVALAKRYRLDNITFVDWVDKSELPHEIEKADVCLGVFGTTPQSRMTVQNKIYEGLAMGKPVITGDAEELRRNLKHQEHLWICERANPAALVRSILHLKENSALSQSMAVRGHRLFRERFSTVAVGSVFARHLSELR